MKKEHKEDPKIELEGLILRIKGQKISLTIEELKVLKGEIEKVLPTQPIIIEKKEYIPYPDTPYIPWKPTPQWPNDNWPNQPWPNYPIVWCSSGTDTDITVNGKLTFDGDSYRGSGGSKCG